MLLSVVLFLLGVRADMVSLLLSPHVMRGAPHVSSSSVRAGRDIYYPGPARLCLT